MSNTNDEKAIETLEPTELETPCESPESSSAGEEDVEFECQLAAILALDPAERVKRLEMLSEQLESDLNPS